ncbi:Tyrosine-protein kinase Fer [Liparis tanakae]|uniref:Tyrosine-protein kinase Fer n=1 Tax=Liparis tanakae TaxID=230148 RepID=A0A4Z2G5Y3_9TELE|nr:Tyrosine-protein kinase Fer [Liparis tanakae]
MGFGRDLRNSHEGLLKLQDWELKMVETEVLVSNMENNPPPAPSAADDRAGESPPPNTLVKT